MQYNHDCLVIVKRRPEKYSLQLATERRQRRCIPDRRRQAVPRTCRRHWEGTVTECWTYGGRYHQHGWVSRAQTTSSVNVRCPVQAVSKVRRRCSMKTAVGQNAQPECDSLRNCQPMEFTKQWGYAFWPPRWENQTGGGIQDRLQPVLLLTINARIKVSKACRDRDRRTLRIWRRAAKHDLTTAVMWVLKDMSASM